MKTRVIAPLAFLPLAACTFKPTVPVQPNDAIVAEEQFSQAANNKADILISVDSSGSMAEEQSNLMANMAAFIGAVAGTGADINIAVVTSDPRNNPEGLFVGQPAGNDPDAPNLPVSVRDGAGNLVRALPDDSGARAVPFCSQAVAAVAPKGGVINPTDPAVIDVIDNFATIPDFSGRANGAFLDANSDGIADNDVTPEFSDFVSCFLSVGIEGFGFEAQLGQIAAALDNDSLTSTNSAFLADPGSVLALIVLTDEEECSQGIGGSDDGNRFTVGSGGLGNSIRCSVASNVQVCSDGPGVFDQLVPVDVFEEKIKALKEDESKIFVATIAGPPSAVIIPDCATDPNLPVASCFSAGTGEASPGNRLFDFAQRFTNSFTALDAPICGSFGDIIADIAAELGALLNSRCLAADIDTANFNEETDILVKIDITAAFDANGNPVTSCDQLGAGVATADPANANVCLLSNDFTDVVNDNACVNAGFEQGLAVQFINFDVPVGSEITISYTAVAN